MNQSESENPKDESLALAKERTVLAVERNRLAAERTLTAWIRAGLGGVGGGLALIRFLTFSTPQKSMIAYASGLALILWGIGAMLYALLSYFHVLKYLSTIHREGAAGKVGITSLVLILIGLSILIFFIAIEW